MLDIKKALAYLRSELDRVNQITVAMEAIAVNKYATRLTRASEKAVKSRKNSSNTAPSGCSIPPRKLDPDAMFWTN